MAPENSFVVPIGSREAQNTDCAGPWRPRSPSTSPVTRTWVSSSQYAHPGTILPLVLKTRLMTLNAGSTETHYSEKLPIDRAVGRHIVIAFVSANRSSRLRPHDPIDESMIVPSASKSTLHLYNRVCIAISVIVVTVVIVRVVPIIRIRIEEWKTKRVEKDERPIVETAEAIVTIVVAIVKPPMRTRHGPWRKT